MREQTSPRRDPFCQQERACVRPNGHAGPHRNSFDAEIGAPSLAPVAAGDVPEDTENQRIFDDFQRLLDEADMTDDHTLLNMIAFLRERVCDRLRALSRSSSHQDAAEHDATDFAHPAWWRGNDAGVESTCRVLTEALNRGEAGVYGSDALTALAQRIVGLQSQEREACATVLTEMIDNHVGGAPVLAECERNVLELARDEILARTSIPTPDTGRNDSDE